MIPKMTSLERLRAEYEAAKDEADAAGEALDKIRQAESNARQEWLDAWERMDKARAKWAWRNDT